MPEIGILFWVIKVLTTGMGEAASDYLANISLILAALLGVAGFTLALWLQLRAPRYTAVVYWFAVMMVAVFGTMVADALHVGLNVPYAGSTAFYAVAVVVIFWRWHYDEATLSIHSITTRRREIYYWATVLSTFALGTAAGDLTASQMNLGFFSSAILFAVLIAVPAIGYWRFRLNGVLAFWIAYVLTRPLGASFADWLGKAHSVHGGQGWGDGTVSAIALVIVAGLVGYLALSRRDIQRSDIQRGDTQPTDTQPSDTQPSHNREHIS